ncbi:cyclin-T1-4-like [Olea europaea subsp. europaea]|uniref:Cyclin-T1-4-like n=2 Tax=Olea europaea subsp. europaea TaxID=158383 RepID=A0A8S0QSW5_OLEEU|nr:cyclin-T1-4-like [Olea europaea subsp. europaea]
MAALFPGDSSHHGAHEVNYKVSQVNSEEGSRWYLSRKEIEENSPSRRDGIDLKKEAYLRKSYCTFLQDLGMRLKVPQVTIATAIIFCHRFFLRQSHVKNDRRTVATVCMFLAGKVEETPRPLKDVILVSYEIIHKKDPAAVQRIKQKEVYEQQKELILLGERVVLTTLGFDLNLLHPYKPLVEAIKKFKVAQNALAQVAWNFVNDGLRTSLCLQFKPHHIAAGAIFLAAKFLKVKLPSDGEKVWWQEFDVTPRQLEEVSNQMLELYEQNRVPPSQASEAEGSAGGSRPLQKAPASEEHVTSHSNSSKPGISASSRPVPDQQHADNHDGQPRTAQTRNNDYGRTNMNAEINSIQDRKGYEEIDDTYNHEREVLPHEGNKGEIQNKSEFGLDGHVQEHEEGNVGRTERWNLLDLKDKHHSRNPGPNDGMVGQSPQDAIKKIDREKVKAALERRKARGDVTRKMDPVDELERELEDVELPGQNEKIKHDRKQIWFKSSNKPEPKNSHHPTYPGEDRDLNYQATKGKLSHVEKFDSVEEGEVELFDDADQEYRSPKLNNRKRKASSPLDKHVDAKQRNDYNHD